MSDTSSNKVNIKLGDIIEINAPTDNTVHNKLFSVEYVGYSQITLIDLTDENGEDVILYIENGEMKVSNQLFLKDQRYQVMLNKMI